ncbi:MAG: DMT family transporter [Alphaproteobacteria bacterium]|nr:DMT family transporter [Alphaproteobacteria bacterium]
MNNAILYILVVLVWGTTWFAIKLQIGHAPDEISILYRAALAAIFLLTWCKIKKFSLRFKLGDHVFLCALGLSMFSLHNLFIYNATNYIISGIIAVIFSGVSFLSIVNNFLFFRTKPSFNVSLGALIGISGLCVFFWGEITRTTLQNNTLKGLGLAAIGTLIFSLGGSISRRNHNKGLDIIPSLAIGMVYGTFAAFIYTLAQSSPFVLPKSAVYWGSLLYLVILGSIVAFLCYLKLIKNIGPELAGYTAVLIPVVALIISSSLEEYTWSTAHLLGLVFVILGNIIVMRKKSLGEIFISKRFTP